MKPSNTIIVSSEYIKEKEQQIARLREQLNEANELLKSLLPIDIWQDDAEVIDYLRKWGVK